MTPKEQIKQYFEDHHGEVLDIGDLWEAFPEMSLPELVEITDSLETENKIKVVSIEG